MMREDTANRIRIERLRAKLKGVGLRSTFSRLHLLELFEQGKGHFSADDLHDQLESQGVLLPRASIYNAVNDFRRTGLIREVEVGSGRAVYEDAQQELHHHFICRICGEILDIPCRTAVSPCIEHSIKKFEVDEARIIFRGACHRCKTT